MLRSGLVALAATLALSTQAFAQDSAAAAAHFDRGLADMVAGKYETGCPALAESFALDPKPGALFTLAECEAKWGRLASAVAHYSEYLELFQRMSPSVQANQRGREKIAADQKAALAPSVPELTVVLPSGAPAGTVVKRDGRVLGAPSLGVALPTDPGEHVITVEVPGVGTRENRLSLEKGDKKELDLELPTSSGTTHEPPKLKDVAPPSPTPESTSSKSPARAIGFVLGGVGLAGIAAGAVTGVLTMQKKKTIEDHCQDVVCDDDGLNAASTSKTLGLVSTIGFAAGGALFVTGLVLVIASPSKRAAPTHGARLRPLATVGPTGGTTGIGGTW